MKKFIVLIVVLLLLLSQWSFVQAADELSYISRPDRVAIFLNNIALGSDTVTLGAGMELTVQLPLQVIPDTLIVHQNDQRVPMYTLHQTSDTYSLSLPAADGERVITLDYLFTGMSWKPLYDMWINPDNVEQVHLDFSVEIQNSAFDMDNTQVKLVAGRVDTTQQLDTISTVTTNQIIAGYDTTGAASLATGAVSIQHVYELGNLTTEVNGTVYAILQQNDLSARRLLSWNAPADRQVTVIYKVKNDSPLPLAEGTVRTYQDDLFLGGDFVEVTPIGSEGSITVGGLQDVRVSRAESRTSIEQTFNRYDTLYQVTLTLTNFSETPVEVEVVDRWNPDGQDFSFSQEPQHEPNNLLRWVVTIPVGATVTLDYQYKTDY